MGLATAFKKLSNKTLMKLGGYVTVKRTTGSSYNVDNGTVLKNQTSVTVKASFEAVSSSEVNDLISQNDKKIMVSAEPFTFVPTPKDTVVVSSIEYKIIRVDKEVQDNIDVLYVLYLRA